MWRHEQGLTLVELLITVLISSVLMALTFSVVTSSRQLYDTDSRRVDVNQNLRTALLVLSNDVRQAGERMPGVFPAVQVVPGTAGASDELTLRRSLLDVVLPLCKDIKSGSSADSVFVARYGGSPKLPDYCRDPDPSRLASWKAYRLANGTVTAPSTKAAVMAYIFDPKNQRGEFFGYDAEDNSGQHIHRANGKWQYDYNVNDGPMIYILEERRYHVDGGTLKLGENGQDAGAVAPNITGLQVSVTLRNGTEVTGAFPTATQGWKQAQQINLSLSGSSTSRGRTTTRTMNEGVTPRNSYSAEN